MEKKSIFRQESLDRVSSPEQLDEYIKVVNPSIWIIVFALLILTVSVAVWGVMGTLPKTLTVSGLILNNNSAVCYVDVTSINKDITGCKAQIITADGKALLGNVSTVSKLPLSAEEIAKTHDSDWIVKKLITDDYAYAVTVDILGTAYEPGTIASVTLITDEVKPISFILN